jgi:predicted dienelactone hydrolase
MQSRAGTLTALYLFAAAFSAGAGFSRQRGGDAFAHDPVVGIVRHQFVRHSDSWGDRRLDATIWYPAAAGTPPSHVIVYSHGGCGGSPQAIAPLANALAAAGFVFVQFPHPGSTADDCATDGERYARALLERPGDIGFVLDSLMTMMASSTTRLFDARIAFDAVGLIGHSQGAQAALLTAAGDPRVAAVLAISPSIAHPDTPPVVWDAVRRDRAPVMLLHGSLDESWPSDGVLRAFDALPADVPRAYLEVARMGHTPSGRDQLALIIRYATTLFRYYVNHESGARDDLMPSAAPPGVTFKSSRFP